MVAWAGGVTARAAGRLSLSLSLRIYYIYDQHRISIDVSHLSYRPTPNIDTCARQLGVKTLAEGDDAELQGFARALPWRDLLAAE